MADKKKVEVKETKVEVKTATFKVFVHCPQCARDIQTQFTEFAGVEEVKVDAGAGKVTVKGFAFDVEKLRKKVEKGCRKKVELIPPAPPKDDMVVEVKSKKEELKVITVKLPLHCPECAVKVKEILLENKSIYEAKTDFGKNTCTVETVLEEDKLVKYIFERTRRKGVVDKVEKKVIVKEEKVLVKKADKEKADKEKKAKEEKEKKEKAEKAAKEAAAKVVKDVIAPYFIPCTHPHFIDFSHPGHRYGCGCGYCSTYGGGYGYGCDGGGYFPPHGGFSYTHTTELKGFQETAFLHCTHPAEFISNENPYACAVM